MVETKETKPVDTLRGKYEIEGTEIEVKARVFLPKEQRGDPNKVMVMCAGWGVTERAGSYTHLMQSLANEMGCRVVLTDTRTDEVVRHSQLNFEAQAIYQLITDNEMVPNIVAGYSEGGSKAVNLAVLAEGGCQMLILFAPAGLYEQKAGDLVKNFIQDAAEAVPDILATKKSDRLKKAVKALVAAGDVVIGIGREMVRSRADYVKRMPAEIEEVARLNERLNQVNIPVIIIQGSKDKPVGPIGKLVAGQMGNNEQAGEVQQALSELFPSSPTITRLLGERYSHHAMTLLRDEQIARIVAYLTERVGEKLSKQIVTPGHEPYFPGKWR